MINPKILGHKGLHITLKHLTLSFQSYATFNNNLLKEEKGNQNLFLRGIKDLLLTKNLIEVDMKGSNIKAIRLTAEGQRLKEIIEMALRLLE